MSEAEDLLAAQLWAAGYHDVQREYRFHPTRRWRFDFAFPDLMLAIEVEGGTWVNGRHTRGIGFRKDAEKYNRAALMGWCVLRFPADQIKSGEPFTMIQEYLQANAE